MVLEMEPRGVCVCVVSALTTDLQSLTQDSYQNLRARILTMKESMPPGLIILGYLGQT